MATTATNTRNLPQQHHFSDIPFSLFDQDCKQGSIHDLTTESKTFLWHQFMVDTLLSTPRTPIDVENVIEACRLVKVYDYDDQIKLTEKNIKEFRKDYESHKAISWYTRDSFFYRAFNMAFRMKNNDAIILFHSIVKDLDDQLKFRQIAQRQSGLLNPPPTLYRGQPVMSAAELKKIKENVGRLISFNTFLSTTSDCSVASFNASGPNPAEAAFFEITVSEEGLGKRNQTWANIADDSKFKNEKEVLFGVSSTFSIVSVEEEDCFWNIKLKLTSWDDDPNVRKFINEVHRYLYQSSGKRLPLIAFQQWFSLESLSYARPMIELVKFGLVQVTQLFLFQAYQKKGHLKKLIDHLPNVSDFIGTSDANIARPNSTIIRPLFDILYDFLYSDKQGQEMSVDSNDNISLLSFGGFLLLTGDLSKGTRYFQMLVDNPAIDERLKIVIHGVLAASYAQNEEKERASHSCQRALEALQVTDERTTPGWFPSLLASSYSTLGYPNQQSSEMIGRLGPSIDEEQSNNLIDEKLRLVFSGHTRFEEQNFRAALNRWEEAAEIDSHMPCSAETIYNDVIHVQMATPYFRLNNRLDALAMIATAIESLKAYYSPDHRMFATLNFMHGYYLMYNDQPAEAMTRLKSALDNPHFAENPEFCAVVIGILMSVCIQSGEMDMAESYGRQALSNGVTHMSGQIRQLLDSIPELRMNAQLVGQSEVRRVLTESLRSGHRLISKGPLHQIKQFDFNDQSTWTSEKLIAVADHYRHARKVERAGFYYRQALERMTANDYQSMWKVFKKMMRMKNQSEDLQDLFSLEYSKYDDKNLAHLNMIATIQVILYRLSVVQNDHKSAFDCLIGAALLTVRSFFHQIHVDSNYISNLFDDFLQHNSIDAAIDTLSKLVEIYSNDWAIPLRSFLSPYINVNDFASLVHHPAVDVFLGRTKSAPTLFQFLEKVFVFLRRTFSPIETTTLAFKDQMLKFLRSAQDEASPLVHLMKAFESFGVGTMENFHVHLDQFRSQVLTFQRYQQLKERITLIFARITEDQLRTWLESLSETSSSL